MQKDENIPGKNLSQKLDDKFGIVKLPEKKDLYIDGKLVIHSTKGVKKPTKRYDEIF